MNQPSSTSTTGSSHRRQRRKLNQQIHAEASQLRRPHLINATAGDTDAMVEPTRSTPEGDEDTLEGGTPGTLPIDALLAAATFDTLHRGNRSS
jgi:hypothetical protein